MGHIVTLDVGTTSIKAGVFDEGMRLRALVSREYALLTPGAGMVELDPETYWRAAKDGIGNALAEAGVDPRAVTALAVTSQGETLIPVDGAGKPLHNAVWLDARAAREAEFLSAQTSADEVYRHTGLSEIGPAAPAAKVLWFKNRMPRVYEATHKFLLVLDFLVYRLTGRFVTDNSVASSTGWVDINRGAPWAEMLRAAGIDEAVLPEMLPCGSVAGPLCKEAAAELGLPAGVAVCACGMDQMSSAVGAGNILPGIVTETTGTALVIATAVEAPDYENRLKLNITPHCGGRYLLLPYCPTAAIVLKWFKDGFCGEEIDESRRRGVPVYDVLGELAESAGPGAGGIVMLPHFSGALSPEADPDARGAILGIGLDTKKGHIVRAIMESVAYMLRENLEALGDMGVAVGQVRSLGGGSKSGLWNSIKADVTGKEIVTMEQEETTSLGAAILGAAATGMYAGVGEACAQAVKIKSRHTPREENRVVYDGLYRLYRSLYGALKPLFGELRRIRQ